MREGIALSSFRVNEKMFQQLINLDTDSVFIRDLDTLKDIGLEFTYDCKIIFKNKLIGKVRLPFLTEQSNIHFDIYDTESKSLFQKKKTVDTGVSEKRSECYLEAEVFITKYLIENKIIEL